MAFNYSGSLAATGSSDGIRLSERFNVILSGTWVGSVALESSADSGTTWVNCLTADAAANAFTTNGHFVVPNVVGDALLFRLTFTRTSGTVAWRIVA